MEIKVCKDVREYRESVVLGLTLRQFTCSIGAVGIAAGLYFLLKDVLGREVASWMCIIGAAPFGVAGFFKYNGLTVEKFIRAWIRTHLVNNGRRTWRSENHYLEIWRDIQNGKNTKKQHGKRKTSKKMETENSTTKHTN